MYFAEKKKNGLPLSRYICYISFQIYLMKKQWDNLYIWHWYIDSDAQNVVIYTRFLDLIPEIEW